MKTINMLSASLLCLAIAQVAQAQEATPQDTGAQEQGGLQDIVVTATRQSTNLQDTPIAITAATSEQLEERGLKSVADLTTTVPNAYFRRTQGAFGPGVSAFIRGIGQGDTNIGLDPAVAFYVDDVYYPVLLGSNFDLLDLDHVEVLRGPQGTLFGRNSLAGAVNIVSKQPRFDEASAYGEVTVGSYNRVDMRAGFNMPLSENLALMVSGISKKRTGYQRILDFTCEMTRQGKTNLIGSVPASNSLLQSSPGNTPNDCTIGHLGGEDVRAVRGAIAFKPAENIKLTITGDYTQDNSENAADSTLEIDPARVSPQINATFNYFGVRYDKRFETGDPFTTYENYNDPITAGTVINAANGLPKSNYYNGFKDKNGVYTRGGYRLSPNGDLQNWGVSGKLEVGLTDQIDLTAILAHRSLHEIHTYAQDGTPILTEMTVNDVTNIYTTAELRLAGKMDWIDWTAGAFYFDAEGTQLAKVISPRSSVQRTLNNTFKPLSKAIYANATVRPFGEKLGIMLGARYSDDKRDVHITNLTDTTPDPSDVNFALSPAAKKFSWKLGVNYAFTDDLLVYASAATGYTPPSYNPRPLQSTQVQQFDGNDDLAYEIGLKLDLFDRRLRLNSAAFYTDFKTRPTTIGGNELNLAIAQDKLGPSTLIPLAGGPAGSTTCRNYAASDGAKDGVTTGVYCIGRTYYQNTPGKVWGFESELTAEPVDGLLINGALGYNKATSPDLYKRVANRRQSNPRWQASAGIQYEIQGAPFGGSITPRVDWSYQSSSTSPSVVQERWNQAAFSLVNARITYKMKDQGLSLAVGATNLFNKLYYLNFFVYQDTAGDGQVEAQPGAPRQWYVTLSKTF